MIKSEGVKANLSSLLVNIMKFENVPTVSCDNENIKLVQKLVEKIFDLGGVPLIKVDFQKKIDREDRLRVSNGINILSSLRGIIKRERIINLFHMMAQNKMWHSNEEFFLKRLLDNSVIREFGL
jgi:hypothetical protein